MPSGSRRSHPGKQGRRSHAAAMPEQLERLVERAPRPGLSGATSTPEAPHAAVEQRHVRPRATRTSTTTGGRPRPPSWMASACGCVRSRRRVATSDGRRRRAASTSRARRDRRARALVELERGQRQRQPAPAQHARHQDVAPEARELLDDRRARVARRGRGSRSGPGCRAARRPGTSRGEPQRPAGRRPAPRGDPTRSSDAASRERVRALGADGPHQLLDPTGADDVDRAAGRRDADSARRARPGRRRRLVEAAAGSTTPARGGRSSRRSSGSMPAPRSQRVICERFTPEQIGDAPSRCGSRA